MTITINTITGMTKNYLEIFFRRKMLFFVPLLLVTSLTVVCSFTVPPLYKTSSIILVEEEKVSNPLISGLAVSSSVKDRLETIVKILLSRPILDQVVGELFLGQDIRPDSLEYEAFVNSLREDISVQLLGRDILKITAQNREPVLCQKITNNITNLFIKHNLELQVRETTTGVEFLKNQREIYEKKLKDSERALREFKELYQDALSKKASEEISGLLGQGSSLVNVEVLRYTGYKEDVVRLNLEYKDALSRKEQLLAQLEKEKEYVVSEKFIDPAVKQLENELSEKQIELAKMEVSATAEHPLVRKLNREIGELKDLIVKKRSQNVSSAGEKESLNPLYQSIKMELSETERTIGSLKTRMALTESYLRDYAERIKLIPKKEEEMANLQRDYSINAKIYEDLTNKLETAYITQRLEMQEKGTKFRVVEPARVPLKPFKPNRQFMALLGLSFGSMLGVGLIFMSEVTDHSFTEINQLKNFLNIPVLASVSQILTIEESEEIRLRKKLWYLITFVFLVFMVVGAVISYILTKSS